MNKSKGSSKSRTKRGCRTCRIRRVKCDEKAPVCQKCASTGRTCEWFNMFLNGLSSAEMSSRANNLPIITKPQSLLAEFPDAKVLELRGFEFFQLRTAQEMCPDFDFGFWQTLVLQVARSEQAILHAAIALGTLHEVEESLGMPVSKDRMTDVKHRFAVAQYNTAIKILTDKANATSRTAHSNGLQILTLTTCLIFIHIDLLRGHYESAKVHIRSALKILNESHRLLSSSFETVMRTAFLRLDLQSAHFDQSAPHYRPPMDVSDSLFTSTLEHRFENIAAGKERYDTLSYYTFRLLRTCEINILKGQWGHLEDDTLKAQQQTLLTLHDLFSQQCEVLSRDLMRFQNRQNHQAIILLQMHAKLTRILLLVCMVKDTESAFEDYTHEFELIIGLAKLYVSELTRNSNRLKMPSLSTDWGIIFPLTFTAIKCRTSTVRRDALAFLDSWPHREGFWDSALSATYARQIVELEEPDIVSDQARSSQRMTNVFVDIPEEQSEITLSWEWNGSESSTSCRHTLNVEI